MRGHRKRHRSSHIARHRSGAGRALALGTAVLFVLGACTPSANPVGTGDVPRELLDRLDSHCTDLRDPTLGEGTLCVDNGFRVAADDFAFANWGRSQSADGNVTVQTLIDLFGHSAVCTPSNEDICTLRPAAMLKLDEWNNALAGGRCEGMATLSTRLQLGIDDPSMFRSGARQAADLRQNDGDLERSIVYWWTTQFLREVSDRAGASRRRSPLVLVDDLIQGLANGVGYTLGMYSAVEGHSVTPFAVTRRNDSYVIHVYDNNHPGTRREVVVSAKTNTWSYRDATVGVDGNPVQWSGSTGSLELTPMSARQGPFECEFCSVTAVADDGPTTITLASRDVAAPGYLRVTARNGGVFEAMPQAISNTIPGAAYEIGKGSRNGATTLKIPSAAGDLDVEVRRTSDDVDASDVVVTVQRPGSPSLQVSGNLATSAVSGNRSAVLLQVRPEATTVSAPPAARARVSFASGSRLSRTNLDAGQRLEVSRVADDSVEVSIKGSNGSVIATTSLAVDGSGASRIVTLSADPVGGAITAKESALEPVSVRKRIPGSTTTTSAPARPTPSTTSPTTVPSIDLTVPD